MTDAPPYAPPAVEGVVVGEAEPTEGGREAPASVRPGSGASEGNLGRDGTGAPAADSREGTQDSLGGEAPVVVQVSETPAEAPPAPCEGPTPPPGPDGGQEAHMDPPSGDTASQQAMSTVQDARDDALQALGFWSAARTTEFEGNLTHLEPLEDRARRPSCNG